MILYIDGGEVYDSFSNESQNPFFELYKNLSSNIPFSNVDTNEEV